MDGPTAVSAPDQDHPRTGHRRWSVVLGVAGIVLVPWIVVLAVVQPRVAPVGDVALAAGGAMAVIAAGLLASAVLTVIRSPYVVVTTSATATTSLCTGFFHVVTGTASNPRAAAFATVLVVVPVAALCVLVAHHGTRPRSRATDRVLAVLFVLAAVATVLAWARAAAAGFDAQYAHHLMLAWVGLDVVEAVALLTAAVALRRRPALVPVAGSVTGALLFCDVWFNVVGAVGEAQVEALQMAAVSIPLGVAGFALGIAEVRQQQARHQEVRQQQVMRRDGADAGP